MNILPSSEAADNRYFKAPKKSKPLKHRPNRDALLAKAIKKMNKDMK